MTLTYSEQAVLDLIRLRAFIAEHDAQAAHRIAQDLLRRIEHLQTFPAFGRSVAPAPQPDAVRDAVFGPYVVRYSVRGVHVIVLRVWHHAEQRTI